MPLGKCVILTALSVVLTDCPPGPLALNTSILISLSWTSTSTSSGSGKTATVAADVWILPLDSVAGTLWTLWTPDSNFNFENTFSPEIDKIISLYPPTSPSDKAIICVFHLFKSLYLWYILYKSPAKIAASSPPVPARISRITSLASALSLGKSINWMDSSICNIFSFNSSNSVFARSSISGSDESSLIISFNSSLSVWNFFQSTIAFFKGSISEYSFENFT